MLVLASTSKEQIQRTGGQAVRVTDLWRAQRVHQQALLLQKVLVSESTKGSTSVLGRLCYASEVKAQTSGDYY